MRFIYNKIFLEHKSNDHPESPERLLAFDNLEESEIENGEKYLNLIYDNDYIELIKKASEKENWLDADTYTNKKSYEVACYAVGAAIKAAKQNDFALSRPPGHHATQNKAMGFCLFNNITIACKWLSERGKRVFLLDLDSHSGNGSQEIFYKTDKVLFLSIHQFPAYPGTGWVNEIGEGKGKYFTINIPVPPYTSDDLFVDVLSKIIPVIWEQYKPDIVAVSAGFDGHKYDPLLNIFACLEGGYNVNVLPHCISAFLLGINNEDMNLKFKEQRTISTANVEREFEARMKSLRLNLDGYWGF